MLLEAEQLEDGETIRTICPYCTGGSKKEKSLAVTKQQNTVLWICYRATCGKAGSKGGRPAYLTTEKKNKKVSCNPYTGSLDYLNEEWKKFLDLELGLTKKHLERMRPMWAVEKQRVAFPIFDPVGKRRGWVLRDYLGASSIKALTRMDIPDITTSWYRPHHSRAVLVVEDIPSAVRASEYMDAVALNGSGVSADGALEIASYYPSVVWALDADATSAALKLHRKYSILFEESQVLILEQDIKNSSEDYLRHLLSELV